MTKEALLNFMSEIDMATANDIATEFDLSYFAASMALLRLCRQSLVARYQDPDSCIFWYELTNRGSERLEYLQNQHP